MPVRDFNYDLQVLRPSSSSQGDRQISERQRAPGDTPFRSPIQRLRRQAIVWLYALTIFVSAFLLFSVQPLAGKIVLPWFGGTASVWSSCLLFFQCLLLAGYIYAHGLVRRGSARRQRVLHWGLLLAALAAVAATAALWQAPLIPSAGWKPQDSSYPAARILLLLAMSSGLPYLALASTSPLIQAWFSRACPGRSPYRLYALSNAGSLLALLSYPFVIEPRLSLRTQAWTWAAGFILFVALSAVCAWRAGAHGPERSGAPPAVPARVPLARLALWTVLAACASLLLVATTSQITQEVAPIPFLWVVPLCLYLLSFILCFESERWYRRDPFLCLFVLSAGLAVIALHGGLGMGQQVACFLSALFCALMVCHGELARLKPPANQLTLFYACVAVGGALGGVFAALIAPSIFRGYWEYHLALWLTALLGLGLRLATPDPKPPRYLDWSAPLPFPMGVLLLAARHNDFAERPFQVLWNTASSLEGGGLILLTGLGVLLVGFGWSPERTQQASRRREAVTAALVLGLLGGNLGVHVHDQLGQALYHSRSFFGVLSVDEIERRNPEEHAYRLCHGTVWHGLQYQAPGKRRRATTYYGPSSGIAKAVQIERALTGSQGRSVRLGFVGLGVGTLAAFTAPGDYLRVYEINPDVLSISTGTRPLFTYLADSPARKDIVPGDARIGLELDLARRGPQGFDLLAIDAFNSDSIPVHLLTREAMRLYLDHLRPDGLLAVNITNSYLDLAPEMRGIAQAFGLASAWISDDEPPGDGWSSDWFLFSRNPALLVRLDTTTPAAHRARAPWTDDFSSLFACLR